MGPILNSVSFTIALFFKLLQELPSRIHFLNTKPYGEIFSPQLTTDTNDPSLYFHTCSAFRDLPQYLDRRKMGLNCWHSCPLGTGITKSYWRDPGAKLPWQWQSSLIRPTIQTSTSQNHCHLVWLTSVLQTVIAQGELPRAFMSGYYYLLKSWYFSPFDLLKVDSSGFNLWLSLNSFANP